MSVTKADLMASVNLELENFTRRGAGQAEADGVLKAFLVTPHGYSLIDNANFAVYLDGVATSAYSMDFTSGICTLSTVPANEVVVSFLYDYVYWSDAVVIQAINAGISSLFPSFYVISLDETITTDGDSYEYDLPALTEYVSSISFRASSDAPWVRYRRENRYEIIHDGVDTSVRFFSPPNEGTLRVSYIARPAEMQVDDYSAVAVSGISVADASVITTSADHNLATGDLVYFTGVSTTPEINLTYQVATVLTSTTFSIPVAVTVASDEAGYITHTDALETTCKLPARAQHPIISYACYYLLTQKVAPRIRADVAIVTQGRGNLSPRQMNDAANSFHLRHQMQLATTRMSPWSQR